MKLSIITINYNNLEGLKKTVDSVLSQTWRDFEWIIVDGGSTDGSKEYIKSLALSLSEGTTMDIVQWHVERFSLPGFTAEDLKTQKIESSLDQSSNPSSSINNRQSSIANSPQRFLWCSEPDKGVYNAMNKGITMASGDYLNFMNSGDCFYEKETLRLVFEKDSNVDVIYGNCLFVDPIVSVVVSYPKLMTIRHLITDFLSHSASFIRLGLLKELRYREDLFIVSDWANFLFWKIDGKQYKHIDIVVSRYDATGISSTNMKKMFDERNVVLAEQLQRRGSYLFKFVCYIEQTRERTSLRSIKGVIVRVMHRILLLLNV